MEHHSIRRHGVNNPGGAKLSRLREFNPTGKGMGTTTNAMGDTRYNKGTKEICGNEEQKL